MTLKEVVQNQYDKIVDTLPEGADRYLLHADLDSFAHAAAKAHWDYINWYNWEKGIVKNKEFKRFFDQLEARHKEWMGEK